MADLGPVPPVPPLPPDFDIQMLDLQDRLNDMRLNLNLDARGLGDQIRAEAKQWAADLALQAPRMALDAQLRGLAALAQPTPQAAQAEQRALRAEQDALRAEQRAMQVRLRRMSDDSLYNAGQRALDQHRYAEALEDFTQAASRGGTRADGALYWKAYALIKLGRRDEALAALAELRKSHPQSRWLDDAKALEVEAGKPVSPESESDEELKLIALNGLMQSDPERALPLLENLLKSNQPPRIKKRVVYVLAASDSSKAQALLEQVARGRGNPDVQLAAIQYLGAHSSQPARAQLLQEIYNSNSDPEIRRAIINSLASDHTRILQIARSEKTPELRAYAIRMLSSRADVASGDALAAMYTADQDEEVRSAILDALSGQHNAKAMVTIARAEKDPKMKQRIVERLASMHSPEATDYLMEILK
ncbi:MAG TPA: HEAT repeat domain-containing protein [Bryobacteraceae bacterium]|nr:HEAT repeat domain-containing protein [Bryobacteraceae bacterium]